MARWHSVVVDCRNAAAQARFWAEAVDGYQVRPYDHAEVARLAELGYTPQTDPGVAVDGPGPGLFFQEVPEPRDTSKNRLHIDIEAPDRGAEVSRLEALGATIHAIHDDWTTMLDPEGNEFCVLDP